MKTMNFTATSGLYKLAGGKDDMVNQISARLAQLRSMLGMTCGEAGASFQSLPDNEQDAYLWACRQMADEIWELSTAMTESGGT